MKPEGVSFKQRGSFFCYITKKLTDEYLVVSLPLCIFVLRKKQEELSRTFSIGKLIKFISIPRHRSRCQWRAAPFGVCLAQRITKATKHSNPVIRSLFISMSAAFFIQRGVPKGMPLLLSGLIFFGGLSKKTYFEPCINQLKYVPLFIISILEKRHTNRQ
ncbi:hypothetical protein M2137_001019 [Parabacteroides sp. PFB2-10]|nr:hypothetical protein [Parabacteroides sp. PFB2-10]